MTAINSIVFQLHTCTSLTNSAVLVCLFDVFLTVHHCIDFFQITNLMHNSFILQQYICYTTLLNMLQAARCSSSGGPIVSPQPLVSSTHQHVSSSTLLILRRTNCITTAFGIVHFSTCFEQHAAHHQQDQLYHHSLWYRHPL